jgi:hypothetical protein
LRCCLSTHGQREKPPACRRDVLLEYWCIDVDILAGMSAEDPNDGVIE